MISSKELKCILLILIFVCIAPLALYIFEVYPYLRDEHAKLAIMATLVLIILLVASIKLPKIFNLQSNLLASIYLFTICTAAMDTALTFALFENLTKFARWYYVNGEKYFQTTAGVFMIGWDGTFHLIIQSVAAFMIFTNRNHKVFSLMWAASVANSLPPLLMGAAIGPFSEQIQLSTALNAPWILFPIATIIYSIKFSKNQQSQEKPIKKNNLSDFLGIIFHFFTIIIHLIRCLVVLGSRTSLAKFWVQNIEPVKDYSKSCDVLVLQWFFLFSPWHILSIYEILVLRYQSFPTVLGRFNGDFSSIFFGAYLHGGFMFIFSSIFEWKDFHLFINPNGTLFSLNFWIINLFVLFGVFLQFIRFNSNSNSEKIKSKKKN